MSTGNRGTIKLSPSSSLSVLVFSPVVIYFGEKSAVLCSGVQGQFSNGFSTGMGKVST